MKHSLSAVQAVILDMDGVLVDTEPIHIRAFCELLDEMGVDYEAEYVNGFVGFSIDDNVRRINRDFFPDSQLDIEECVEKRDRMYLDILRATALHPLPGIRELTEVCRKKGLQLALASSSDRNQIQAILQNLKENGFDLKPYLNVVVSGDEVEHRKPDSQIYRLTLQRLGCPPEQALAIEDSEAGVESAKAAGVLCAALKNPYITDHRLKKADFLIDRINEVATALNSNPGKK